MFLKTLQPVVAAALLAFAGVAGAESITPAAGGSNGQQGQGVSHDALVQTISFTLGQDAQNALPQGQYILQVQKNGTTSEASITSIAAVPLPGALWMFGAGLLGFVGFATRRKV